MPNNLKSGARSITELSLVWKRSEFSPQDCLMELRRYMAVDELFLNDGEMNSIDKHLVTFPNEVFRIILKRQVYGSKNGFHIYELSWKPMTLFYSWSVREMLMT